MLGELLADEQEQSDRCQHQDSRLGDQHISALGQNQHAVIGESGTSGVLQRPEGSTASENTEQRSHGHARVERRLAQQTEIDHQHQQRGDFQYGFG